MLIVVVQKMARLKQLPYGVAGTISSVFEAKAQTKEIDDKVACRHQRGATYSQVSFARPKRYRICITQLAAEKAA